MKSPARGDKRKQMGLWVSLQSQQSRDACGLAEETARADAMDLTHTGERALLNWVNSVIS